MNPTLTGIVVLDNYKLLLKFDNNENRIFDAKHYLSSNEFENLKNYDDFKKVSVNSGTISWVSGVNLNMDNVYNQSEIYDTLGENEY